MKSVRAGYRSRRADRAPICEKVRGVSTAGLHHRSARRANRASGSKTSSVCAKPLRSPTICGSTPDDARRAAINLRIS
jgi:hypothetical protein